MTEGPVVLRSGEEWEIVNDDGLIYKRRKKDVDVESSSQIPSASVLPENDTHWRRTRKKAALRQLKERYVAEIDEWEKLLEKLEKPSEPAPIYKEGSENEAPADPILNVSGKQFGTSIKKLSCQLRKHSRKLYAFMHDSQNCNCKLSALSYMVEQLEMFMEELKALCYDVEYICKRPDEYGEFHEYIKSPRLLIDAFQSANSSTLIEQEITP